MKKIHLILVLLFAFALLISTSGVASAISISPKYVGNTMVDLSWTQYESTDFSKYELCRDGDLIATITRSITITSITQITATITVIIPGISPRPQARTSLVVLISGETIGVITKARI